MPSDKHYAATRGQPVSMFAFIADDELLLLVLGRAGSCSPGEGYLAGTRIKALNKLVPIMRLENVTRVRTKRT